MIIVNGKQYRFLSDEIFVNGNKVKAVYVNDQKVYPLVFGKGGTYSYYGSCLAKDVANYSDNNLYTFRYENITTIPDNMYIAFIKVNNKTADGTNRYQLSIYRYLFWTGGSKSPIYSVRQIRDWSNGRHIENIDEPSQTYGHQPTSRPAHGIYFDYSGYGFPEPFYYGLTNAEFFAEYNGYSPSDEIAGDMLDMILAGN